MKKMRDEAAKSPGQAATAAKSPTLNSEMNNVATVAALGKQNAAVGKDELRSLDLACAAAGPDTASERTSDHSVSEVLVSWSSITE